MNFFQAQDDARRKTGQLVVLFGIAVVVLIALTNLLVAIFVATGSDHVRPSSSEATQ